VAASVTAEVAPVTVTLVGAAPVAGGGSDVTGEVVGRICGTVTVGTETVGTDTEGTVVSPAAPGAWAANAKPAAATGATQAARTARRRTLLFPATCTFIGATSAEHDAVSSGRIVRRCDAIGDPLEA
jgi:hypothetical protein